MNSEGFCDRSVWCRANGFGGDVFPSGRIIGQHKPDRTEPAICIDYLRAFFLAAFLADFFLVAFLAVTFLAAFFLVVFFLADFFFLPPKMPSQLFEYFSFAPIRKMVMVQVKQGSRKKRGLVVGFRNVGVVEGWLADFLGRSG